ncbi:potassium transporter KefB [Dyadobacter sp. CY312]|uniref:potassium transporter KefB n=1 Tax=Dyadobacter sp. CY312 TaxID=2907303 RepID=UPI001F4100E6|nr:potassium transporter KefB [Dyadobacter sp. CY312]MCE7039617.1 potassium transporter KefB [Dyadobacter sp. CY312]
MTQQQGLSTEPLHSASVAKRMLQGAGVALVLISIFLFPIDDANPAWGKWWMIRPLLMVPAAGAMGGVFYYVMDHLRYQGGWKKAAAYLISLLGYIVALWLGTVLGLNGTLWN